MSYPTNHKDYAPDDPEPTEAQLAEQAQDNSRFILTELQSLASALHDCEGAKTSGVEIVYALLDVIGDHVNIATDTLCAAWPALKAVDDRYAAQRKAEFEQRKADLAARKAVQS